MRSGGAHLNMRSQIGDAVFERIFIAGHAALCNHFQTVEISSAQFSVGGKRQHFRMQLDARYAKRIVDGERYIASARVERFDIVLPPQNSCSHSCERRVYDIRQFVGRTIRQLFVFFKIDSLVGVYTFSDKRVDAELLSGCCNRLYVALYFRLPCFVVFYNLLDIYERYEHFTRPKHIIDLCFCDGV